MPNPNGNPQNLTRAGMGRPRLSLAGSWSVQLQRDIDSELLRIAEETDQPRAQVLRKWLRHLINTNDYQTLREIARSEFD